MIESVKFENFRVLRDTTLPLGPFTLLVGPNGSGKSTAIQGLMAIGGQLNPQRSQIATLGAKPTLRSSIELTWGLPRSTERVATGIEWQVQQFGESGHPIGEWRDYLGVYLRQIRAFSFDAPAIATAVTLQPQAEMGRMGEKLVNVLDRLRDEAPERFEAINSEFGKWIPEFDRILFETPSAGMRSIALRTRRGHESISSQNLSTGTLIALCLLTLSHLPTPPTLVCLEEPDRGLHPRLLRDVRDALYRLCYPENFGESRPAVQVLATTHSPYLLDLFRDDPSQIVIAEKVGNDAKFERLSDRKDIDEILKDTPLGEAWYSGVLGGVPAGR